MTTPYSSLTKIASRAAKAGHVVGHENGVTTIETGTITLTFQPDGTVKDAAGKTYTRDQAVDQLGISLS